MGRPPGGVGAPSEDVSFYLCIYISILLYLWQGHLVFLFFPTVLERCWVAEHIFDVFKYYSWRRSRWWGCGLMMCTGVY